MKKPEGIPKPEQARLIFKDTYNFYLRWKDILTQDNVGQMMQEAYALEHKYDCSLCRHMIADLIECIEAEYRRREEGAK